MFTEEFKICMFAIVLSFAICVILSPIFIPMLRKFKFGQYIREEGLESHKKKSGTPTMGGIIILLAASIASCFFMKDHPDLIAIVLVTLGYGIIGFLDDFLKIKNKRNLGLTAWQKMLGLLVVTGLFLYYVIAIKQIGTTTLIPFTNGYYLDLKWLYIPFALCVMLGTTNSVNLTDGLDGLATGVTILVTTFFATIAYKSFPEIAPVTCTIIGALLGFLLFNAHPAKIFMGDTGSLALGGFLASFTIITKMPFFLVIVGIVYVCESLSVIIQVTSFKLTGKRVFKMAPIHHHFELCGWKETRVVDVFYVVTAISCLIGFLAL
ncbi:MAG: phospho-N-acetylmuramoyl-pentapeptide-transferase [Clostridia bacterium]|nr:phospho-N-acetylmuramoyl-pentapeptide-transferase [Clostridia bacterium]